MNSDALPEPSRDTGEVQIGTAGWDGEATVEVIGEGAGDFTTVRVTLFEGRELSKADPDPSVASGLRIQAMLPGQQVPKRGTFCWCVRAAGTTAWMLVANQTRNSTDQFTGAGRTLLDYGDDTDVVIRAKSVSIQSADGHFIAVGPRTGIQASDPNGSGFRLVNNKWMLWVADAGDAKSVLQMTASTVQIAQKGAGSAKSSSTWSGAHLNQVGTGQFTARFPNGALGCFPGALPTLLPILVVNPAFPAVPIPSTSWYGPGA